MGSGIGAKVANPSGGQFLYSGGMGAAASNYRANAYNPFAEALTGASSNPTFRDAASRFFDPYRGSSTGSGYGDPYANVRTSSFT
jgi:hypothetical protein